MYFRNELIGAYRWEHFYELSSTRWFKVSTAQSIKSEQQEAGIWAVAVAVTTTTRQGGREVHITDLL